MLKALAVGILAVSAIVFALLLRLTWPFTADDSFITMRYAANLAAGYGPTYNAGHPAVEGCTTFLWMALLAVPHLLHLDAALFAKLAGVVATVATLVLVFRWVVRLSSDLDPGRRAVPGAIAVLLLVSLFPTPVHAVSGMETALFTLLLLLFLRMLTDVVDDQPTAARGGLSTVGLPVVGLLLSLTRPEGNLVVAIGLLSAWWQLPPHERSPLARRTVVFYVLPGAVYFAWRFLYYRHLMPLPYYVKATSRELLPGFPPVLGLVRYFGLYAGTLVVLGLVGIRRTLFPALIAAGALVAYCLRPIHIMGFCWRYVFPVVPFLCVIAGRGTAVLWSWTRSMAGSRPNQRAVAPAFAACVVAAMIGGLAFDAPRRLRTERDYGTGMNAAHIPLGRRLAEFPSAGRPPLLAIGDAGAVPYYSNWPTLDTFGLNDERIALTHEHRADYVLSRHPDLLVLVSTSRDVFAADPELPWERGLYDEGRRRGWREIEALRFDRHYYLWLMALPGSRVDRYLRQVPAVR